MKATTLNWTFALAILTLFGRDSWLSNANNYVVAFCSSNVNNVGGRWRTSLQSARNNSTSINEWVSKLEEEFHKSDDNHPEPKQHRPFQTPVKTHTNAMDLLTQIDTAPPNDLTIVLFFAHYCKTCQRAFAPYKQLANDATQDLHFCRLETSALSPKQFASMGIDRVPFLQIYRNGICVASLSATQKITPTSSKIVLKQRLLEQIDACQRRSMTEWSAFRDQHDKEIEANKAARIRIQEANQNGVHENNDDEDERLYRSVRTLTSEHELLNLLENNSEDDENEIVAIMFHSHFDPSCLRAQHKFRKIASERQPNTPTMARIEASVLSERTLQSLGVQKYPHIQIYRSSENSKQCVASFSIPRSFLFAKLLHESLDAIDRRTPEEWYDFYNQHQGEIASQQLALEGIRREQEP